MNFTDLTLAEAARELRAGDTSASELTDFFLDRIATLNPRLNAFLLVTPDGAHAEAVKADDELAHGGYRGPLHGIPLGVKDLFAMNKVPLSAGSKILRGTISAEDAAATAHLREAGAVLLGKLNMHEFAYGVTNENPHYGNAVNPWDPDRIPGGSSGGSAAAVAARLCLGTLGTDTGGSIRIPAALCGVTGLKPTYGRVSLRGVYPLSWSMDHAGPITQTAQDAALLLQAIAGYDPLDPASTDIPVPDYTASLNLPITGVRLAGPSGYFAADVDAEVANPVAAAIQVLEQAGATRVDRELSFGEDLFLTNRTVLSAEAAALHQPYLETRAEDYGADVLKRLRNGERISTPEYARARRRQVELRRELESFFSEVDLLATATTRVPAPRIGADAVAMSQHMTAFTGPFNLTGFPAISIPCGFTKSGLPIGLQLVARPWNEALLLQVAHQYQQRTDWHKQMPNVEC